MRHIKGGQDEYYTRDDVATHFVHKTITYLYPKEVKLFVEPSAGEGAFIKPLLGMDYPVVAYDINPKHNEIVQADFLTLKLPERLTDGLTVAIGNPPFGFASNNAIKFFNRCAEFADYIAFVVPRTFKKISVQNKLHKNFHLVKEYEVPKYAFVVGGKSHNVPCVYQIWERRETLRPIKAGNLNKYLKLSSPEEADFAMRRVGGKAGEILKGLNHSPSSTYFFKELKKGVKDALMNADFESTRDNTAGVRSISQLEIIEYLDEHFK